MRKRIPLDDALKIYVMLTSGTYEHRRRGVFNKLLSKYKLTMSEAAEIAEMVEEKFEIFIIRTLRKEDGGETKES